MKKQLIIKVNQVMPGEKVRFAPLTAARYGAVPDQVYTVKKATPNSWDLEGTHIIDQRVELAELPGKKIPTFALHLGNEGFIRIPREELTEEEIQMMQGKK